MFILTIFPQHLYYDHIMIWYDDAQNIWIDMDKCDAVCDDVMCGLCSDGQRW